MASTRTFFLPGIFASTALTTIPASPITGTAYRDATIGNAEFITGWEFNTIVDSTELNQILFTHGSMLDELDKQGILGWTDQVDYGLNALVRGSDGEFYYAIQVNGPSSAVKDPISEPTFWTVSGVKASTVPDASETVKGIAEIATQAETDAGTDDTRFITPLKLKNTTGTSGLVLLATATASNSATIDFTTGIDATYEEYEIHCINVVAVTNAVTLYLRVSTDGGATFKSGVSDYTRLSLGNSTSATGASGNGSTASSFIRFASSSGISNGVNKQQNLIIKAFNPANASLSTTFIGNNVEDNQSGSFVQNQHAGKYNTAGITDAFRILLSSGNISSGEFKLYGVKK